MNMENKIKENKKSEYFKAIMTKIKEISFPLPIYKIIEIGEAISKDGENFSISVGLNKEIIAQLQASSLNESDIELQKNTSDKKRFGDESYEDWYKKNRTPFVLVHKNTNTLAALVWFGLEPLSGKEGNWHTAGWRSYNPFRGKGLMKEFTKFAMDVYVQKTPNVKFWIATEKENIGSVELAKFLGFQELKTTSESNTNRLIMVKN